MSVLAPPRPDARKLPLGLTRYAPGVFEKLHDAGSGVFTASLISALFGESRFTGRFAAMCHVAGLVPIKFAGNQLTERGKALESLVISMVDEDHPWSSVQARAWRRHPRIAGLVASPDAVSWRAVGDTLEVEPGIGEVKVVNELDFQQRWLDGPPLDVELQHQTQFACTGAAWGWIAALVVGAFRWDLLVYPTEPDPRVIGIIEDEVTKALADLEAGDMGAPDEHGSSIAAAERLWAPDPSKILHLNDPEADDRLERWLQARADRLAAEKLEDAQQRYFAARALDHALIRCPGGGSVKVSLHRRKAFAVEAQEVRRMEPKPAKEEA